MDCAENGGGTAARLSAECSGSFVSGFLAVPGSLTVLSLWVFVHTLSPFTRHSWQFPFLNLFTYKLYFQVYALNFLYTFFVFTHINSLHGRIDSHRSSLHIIIIILNILLYNYYYIIIIIMAYYSVM